MKDIKDLTKYDKSALHQFAKLAETPLWESVLTWIEGYMEHQAINSLRLDSNDIGLAATHAQYKGRVLGVKRLRDLVQNSADIIDQSAKKSKGKGKKDNLY